jgi:hypothetical protein
MAARQTPKVLRVAVVCDGKVCDEFHQTAPASVSTGRRLGNKLFVYDETIKAPDYRKNAPIWLALGLLLFMVGAGVFAWRLGEYKEWRAEQEAQTEMVRGKYTMYSYEGGSLDLVAVAMMLVGLVPLVIGVMGVSTPARAAEKVTTPPGPPAPERHPLFDFRDGVYFLDLPPHARGKISLGKKAATITQLRKRFGRGDRLRVKLNPQAKGKLILGDTTLLFQFADPAPVPRREALPEGLINPWRLLAVNPLEAVVFLACLILLGGTFFYYGVIAEPTGGGEIDKRFVDAMGIAKYEPEEEEPEEPEEEVKEDELALEEEEKEEDKEIEDKIEKIVDKPTKFSDEAMKEARGVGVARVLGTYGGPGEGTIFDVIQDTENNLGDLMADGTSIIDADAGTVSEYVPGGEGISAKGGMVKGDGIGGEGGEALGDKTKTEKKIRPKMDSATDEIYGDVDKQAVQATIRRRTSALKVCYEKALRTQPNLKGKITYTISISTVGRVTSVEIEGDTLQDASVRSCTKAKIQGWRFPVAGAEEAAEVTFSVVYSGAE